MKRLVISLLLAGLASTPVWGANESREKQMLRRLQQQVQQTEQARTQAEHEKTAALADKDAAERELEKLSATKRQLASANATRTKVEGELKSAQTELETLKARLTDLEKKLADSVTLQRSTAEKLALNESAQKLSVQQLADSRQDLKVCREHNSRLYSLGRELSVKYRDKSCQDALAQAEPFTGLKKIEVENLMEIWRDQLDRDKLSAAGPH